MLNRIYFFSAIFFVVLIWSCDSASVPKPRGYFRIDFPEKEYRVFDSIYPFTFRYPVYGKVNPESNRGQDGGQWLNVDFPQYKARIHLSYKDVSGNLNAMMEDARSLAYKHTVKADAIDERIFSNSEKKVYGVLYDIRGNSASSIQFFLTDSSKHYIRGALYFRVEPNKDSLAPAVDFFTKDVVAFIESFEWKIK
ncbi:MAG TPA: gliding motility lipoprotein GldD [Tenuifilaceae bacterium]|nr:gliding motility lipoprotein GldD [Tenuifilaceae bacterium]HOZ14601.1 gliding motility lipoprotein GldD [Tenuifilaceae bacterium]HPI45975.1 gliding motility lipoprotein GldD [Tenuifilaceae bacterium]HPN21624.1 gliding motility lipoprotein GldD [Tenuifilaceae bacterium]